MIGSPSGLSFYFPWRCRDAIVPQDRQRGQALPQVGALAIAGPLTNKAVNVGPPQALQPLVDLPPPAAGGG